MDESYLLAPQTKEKVWCRIDEEGNLAYVDWEMVERLAQNFNDTPPENRTEQMLIAKLMWLVKQGG